MKRISIQPNRLFCPQPMYVIGTRNEDDTPNFSVITWIGFSWNGSPHIMLGVGGLKRTAVNILREKEFSANLVNGDMLWLADYFGSIKGNDRTKNDINYKFLWSEVVHAPILDSSNWVFECSVKKIVELEDSHIFISEIMNIQIDEQFAKMDFNMLDLKKINPVLYAPTNYFSIGDKLGNCQEWSNHLK